MVVDSQQVAGLKAIFSHDDDVSAHCQQVGECP